MLNEINPIKSSQEGISSLYAAALPRMEAGGAGYDKSLPRFQSVSAISTRDTVDFENTEPAEEKESSNVQALKRSLSLNQGFEPGLQPSFAISSLTGVSDGLEPGIQPAGIFKPQG